ncbi:putative reverse transcriptase domain-containing protein [Tanacetum coccineum]|uniref:Reverse transcriptase domain-containing protein n=1 Tax=Tanacetum coccineum TaxID=301880 RepID=A0ABQ5F0I9_9ASTR
MSWVDIPENYCIPDDENGISNLIKFIYDNDTLRKPTARELQEKAIVCSKNETTEIINAKVMPMLPGSTHTYISFDEDLPHGHDVGEVELLYPKVCLNTLVEIVWREFCAALRDSQDPLGPYEFECSSVDTIWITRNRDNERRMMTALEMVQPAKDRAGSEELRYETTTPETAHAMPWATLKKMMTDKYSLYSLLPEGVRIRKLKLEMWNLRMFPEEIDKIEKYIGGLPDMIHGSVKASKPKTMQEAIEFTTELMDEKTHAYAERQAERKRKYDDLSKNNQNQQQQNKRQNTGQAYTAGNSDRKSYAGSKPLCSKCNYNHEEVGLQMPTTTITTTTTTTTATTTTIKSEGQRLHDARAQGHFRRNCPKLRNNDRGNQAGNDRAPAKVYVVGNAGANPDNVVAGLTLPGAPILAFPERSEDFSPTATLQKGLGACLCKEKSSVRSQDLEAQYVRNNVYRFTNHKSLQHILESEALNMRQQRQWKEREPPLRVRALVMTISLDLPKQILNAQTEARKPENIKKEDVGGMLVENAKKKIA